MIRRVSSLAITLGYSSWSSLWNRARNRCVVLYYHGVTDAQAPAFRRQMQWLRESTSILPLRSLSEGSWKGPAVVITFDDALDNVRRNALPVLREWSIPAAVFPVAGRIASKPWWEMKYDHPDRNEPLSTPEQLRDYPSELIEIGSHTVSHADLASLDALQLRSELRESKSTLEQWTSREVRSLSVPYGSYNEHTLIAAQEAGYEMVVTCDPIAVLPGRAPFVVGRFKVTPEDWQIEYRLKATGGHAWRAAWQKMRGGLRADAGRESKASTGTHSPRLVP